MPQDSTPSTTQQFFRVLRHERPLFAATLAKNASVWATHKFLLKNHWLQKNIHDYKMVFDLTDSGISRSLLLVGDREREHRYILSKAINPGDKVLDLGANIGYYVLMEHKLMKEKGHVIAIEPEPNNFKLLKKNIELNNFSSLTTTINAAVSDNDGTADLHLSKLANVHSLKQQQTSQYTGLSIPVTTISLATIASEHPDIDLIRMDIEGYEQEILQSIIEINKSQKFLPKILFELHPPKYSALKFNQLLTNLHELGYGASFLATSHMDLIKKHGLSVAARLPTDGTVRYITPDVPIGSLIDLYPHSRAVLLQNKSDA
jgi:FkbM family methyltransferase